MNTRATTTKSMYFKAISEKNWLLLVFAVLVGIFAFAFIAIGVVFWASLSLLAPVLIVSGLSSLFFVYKALKDNQPAWLLLDVILPN